MLLGFDVEVLPNLDETLTPKVEPDRTLELFVLFKPHSPVQGDFRRDSGLTAHLETLVSEVDGMPCLRRNRFHFDSTTIRTPKRMVDPTSVGFG